MPAEDVAFMCILKRKYTYILCTLELSGKKQKSYPVEEN